MANVLLAHQSAPFENSAWILFFVSTCLKSEIFSSFMNTELCGGISASSIGSKVSTFVASATAVVERAKQKGKYNLSPERSNPNEAHACHQFRHHHCHHYPDPRPLVHYYCCCYCSLQFHLWCWSYHFHWSSVWFSYFASPIEHRSRQLLRPYHVGIEAERQALRSISLDRCVFRSLRQPHHLCSVWTRGRQCSANNDWPRAQYFLVSRAQQPPDAVATVIKFSTVIRHPIGLRNQWTAPAHGLRPPFDYWCIWLVSPATKYLHERFIEKSIMYLKNLKLFISINSTVFIRFVIFKILFLNVCTIVSAIVGRTRITRNTNVSQFVFIQLNDLAVIVVP